MANLAALLAAVFFAICEKPEGADNQAVRGLQYVLFCLQWSVTIKTTSHLRPDSLKFEKFVFTTETKLFCKEFIILACD